eukprot:14108562-Ditylum_brightwellii.AAC.1
MSCSGSKRRIGTGKVKVGLSLRGRAIGCRGAALGSRAGQQLRSVVCGPLKEGWRRRDWHGCQQLGAMEEAHAGTYINSAAVDMP